MKVSCTPWGYSTAAASTVTSSAPSFVSLSRVAVSELEGSGYDSVVGCFSDSLTGIASEFAAMVGDMRLWMRLLSVGSRVEWLRFGTDYTGLNQLVLHWAPKSYIYRSSRAGRIRTSRFTEIAFCQQTDFGLDFGISAECWHISLHMSPMFDRTTELDRHPLTPELRLRLEVQIQNMLSICFCPIFHLMSGTTFQGEK